jgi:glycosyltransferase involved in cell wall biosynthesis
MMSVPPSKPLRIAQVAPLWTSVPPLTYGGTELVVSLLTEELVRRGHDVTLFASGDSRTSANLQVCCERQLLAAMGSDEAYEYEHYANSALGEAIRRAGSFDLIHCHLGCSYIPFAALSSAPMLYSIHSAVTLDDRWILVRYPEVPISCLSQSQAEAVPPRDCDNLHVISNPCNFDAYEPSFHPGKYLAYLGRMGRHKGPLDAIRIAKQVGMPLVLGGAPLNAEEESYFSDAIQPLIDGVNVTYKGPVDHAQKNELLRNAGALLFPIQWPEPFGMVMVEAMACGTPVIACETGSVPEIIEFGKTGFFSRSVQQLASFVEPALCIDRRAVRERAMQRFGHEHIADGYTRLYQALIRRTGSVARLERRAGELSDF